MSEGHREFLRVVAPVAIMLHYNGWTEVCVTRNFSLGGLFALTEVKPGLGELVTVTFVLRGERFSAVAEVAAVEGGSGIGLKYLDRTEGFRSRLEDVLNKMIQTKGYQKLPSLPTNIQMTFESTQDIPWWQKPFGRRQYKSSVTNIHVDGASLKTRRRPFIGERLTIALALEGLEPEHYPNTAAHVVRHLDQGFAIRFDNPSLEFRQTINGLRGTRAQQASPTEVVTHPVAQAA